MLLLLLSCLLAPALAGDSCRDCKAVVSSLRDALLTSDSIAIQQVTLEAGLCLDAPDPTGCVAGITSHWGQVAALLWPGYYNRQASWTCEKRCVFPQEEVMDCASCQAGVQLSIEQLQTDYFLDTIVTGLGGDWYCASAAQSPEEQEACASFIDLVIRQGIPLLTENSYGLDIPTVCNTAVERTCPDAATATAPPPTSAPTAEPAVPTTCSNCKDVVRTAAAWLTSPESMAAQSDLMFSLCNTLVNRKECEEGMRAFWMDIGPLLWRGYFNVDAEWTCGTRCSSPTEEIMDCNSCIFGVRLAEKQLLSDYFTDVIVGGLGGDWYCTNPASPSQYQRCPEYVDFTIRRGLPLLKFVFDNNFNGFLPELCERAVPGTCPPRLE